MVWAAPAWLVKASAEASLVQAPALVRALVQVRELVQALVQLQNTAVRCHIDKKHKKAKKMCSLLPLCFVSV